MGLFPRAAAPLLAASAFLGSTASAASLTLSDLSSDETPAEVFDATYDFQITGPNELTLSVSNDTLAPDLYWLREIYWNASDDVASLTLVSASSSVDGDVLAEWSLRTASAADGFGRFDFELGPIQQNVSNELAPGEVVDFVLSIDPNGPVDAFDFTTQFSTIPPGDRPALAAGFFQMGPGDDSGFGAVIPEPTTAALLGLGLAALGLGRRAGRA